MDRQLSLRLHGGTLASNTTTTLQVCASGELQSVSEIKKLVKGVLLSCMFVCLCEDRNCKCAQHGLSCQHSLVGHYSARLGAL